MVTTRIFCIGDTHDKTAWPRRLDQFDVVMHCGDLTDKSTLSDFRRAVHFLEDLDAPLKLVIPGNHDATLDPEAYYRMVSDSVIQTKSQQQDFVTKYGLWGEARQLFVDAGIILLSLGTHKFVLDNGASLSVYANPYTPSNTPTGGFQYRPEDGRRYFSDLTEHVDVVLTHGPPHGMLDRDYESRLCGCPGLLAAVSRAKPLLHIFGHIHEDWGAVYATWEKGRNQIDFDKTWPLRRWADDELEQGDSDNTRQRESKENEWPECSEMTGAGEYEDMVLRKGRNTLFLNTAVVRWRTESRPPWIVEIDLPPATQIDKA